MLIIASPIKFLKMMEFLSKSKFEYSSTRFPKYDMVDFSGKEFYFINCFLYTKPGEMILWINITLFQTTQNTGWWS